MKKKLLILSGIVLALCIVIIGVFLYRESKVIPFEDEKMRELIAETAEVENPDDLTQEDLEKITDLNIGYTGYYETLSDIEKCRNLNRLIIGEPDSVIRVYPFRVPAPIPEPESKERIEQIQQELEGILTKCTKLTYLKIGNEEGTCTLSSLDFIKKSSSIESVDLAWQGKMDYSVLFEKTGLITLNLTGCEIEDLRGIENLDNLELIILDGVQVDLAPITECKELDTIYLDGCDLSSLENLSALGYLKELSLNHCDITPLGDFKELKYVTSLELNKTNISDATYLLNCEYLKYLNIYNTPLAKNEEELEKLREAMPELDIRK